MPEPGPLTPFQYPALPNSTPDVPSTECKVQGLDSVFLLSCPQDWIKCWGGGRKMISYSNPNNLFKSLICHWKKKENGAKGSWKECKFVICFMNRDFMLHDSNQVIYL